jgi:hypothetical protein
MLFNNASGVEQSAIPDRSGRNRRARKSILSAEKSAGSIATNTDKSAILHQLDKPRSLLAATCSSK